MPSRIAIHAVVIDDDEAVCRRLLAALAELGCDAATFTNPAEGLRHAVAADCPLALIDLRLPDRDGTAVIADLLQQRPAARVIALCAFPDVPLVTGALRAGARDLLEKPLSPAAVRAAVERQLVQLGAPGRTEHDFNAWLGGRLRHYRTQAKRTLNQIAKASGLATAQLSQIETGKSATSTWTLARIATALRVPLSQVFRDD